jgi:glycine/D-amino acid oxidase-like deaminating enzyme
VRSVRPASAKLADGRELPLDGAVVCPGAELRTLYPDLWSHANSMLCRLQMFSLTPPHATFELGPMLAAGLTLLHYKSFADCPSLPALRERMMRTHAPWLARGIHVLVSQGADGRLIVGDSHEYGESFAPGSDPAIESLILAGLDTMFLAEPLSIQRRWSGVYAMRRDGSGVLRAQPDEGIEVITGVGGSGMTRSFAIAETTIDAMSR